MIHYALICDAAHEFDGWFRDSAAFDQQAAGGAISCPFCRSTKVTKAVMAPHVARPAQGRERDSVREGVAKPASDPLPAAEPPSALQAQLRAKLREMRETILAATEDVGERFPAEARRMQDGEAKPRLIRGQASLDEAKELIEEGIVVWPLPGEGH